MGVSKHVECYNYSGCAMAEDWSEFFPSALIEVKRTEQYGRGLYARAALRPGKEVLSRPPYAHVLDNSRRGAYCDACFALSESVECARGEERERK